MGFKHVTMSLLGLILLGASLSAHGEQKNFLVLYSYHPSLPWTLTFQRGLDAANRRYGNSIDYFIENMESIRLLNGMSDSEWADYLQRKYRSVHIDAVLADSSRASDFINQHGELFERVPRVLYTAKQLERRPNTFYHRSLFRQAVGDTLKLAMRQNPDTRSIVLIEGESPESGNVPEFLASAAAAWPDVALRQVDASDYTVEELRVMLEEAEEDTVVFFATVFADKTGRAVAPKTVLTELARTSAVPIYTFWSSLMVSGAVGGCMIDGEITAGEMVRAAFDYLETGAFGTDYNTLRTVLDWQALRRYGLRLPDDSSGDVLIINHPEPFLVRHYRAAVAAGLGVSLVFLLLALYWNKKISLANAQLKEANIKINEARSVAEEYARTDTLTSLLNRRAIEPLIAKDMHRRNRMNSPVSLMILDLDHFKLINDQRGHALGDEVLQSVAQKIQSLIRATDSVARWGGDEFLVAASDTPGDAALSLAEKIRRGIMDLRFTEAGTVTVSVGVAEYHPSETFRQWYERADEALYRAKELGRNCVLLNRGSPEKAAADFLAQDGVLELKWKPEYFSGISGIDQQHKALFSLANQIMNYILTENRKQTDQGLVDFYEEVSAHFTYEEKLLSDLGYPEREHHLQEHTRIGSRLEQLISGYRNGSLDLLQLMRVAVRELIGGHLETEDMAFIDWIRREERPR